MADHSTEPDKATGWQPREVVVKLRQFPLVFMNPSVDLVSKTLTAFGNSQAYRVVYMGPRHSSNIKAFKAHCQSENHKKVEEGKVYGVQQLNRFPFKHQAQAQKFFPIRVSQYRLFTGMNPTFKKDDLRFDSDFQSGNLDLAIYVNPAEYDLIMRVDSNTKGHTAWFYFRVTNPNPSQKIKFNIINYSKKKLLFVQGMKPYVFKNKQWTQNGCISVTYSKKKLRYEGAEQVAYQCLSFIYEFKDTDEVYFAYCVPYSYSYLLHRIQEIRSKAPHFIKVSMESQSTGGLPIPYLTITNFTNSQSEKTNALCIARLHPGETQGSWLMDGFMSKLLSPEAHYLRERMVFHLIPMVNVDGVVLGNFRTGIMGRDLNRCFHICDKYNQITFIRSLADRIRPQLFLDFHGHSAKKNVFIYGPNYKLQDQNYVMCRVLPKLISKQTDAFRYYSCSFQISKSKQTTGRAIMLNQFKTQFSYTVQASAFSYGPTKAEVCFTSQQYQQVGAKIGDALSDFVKICKVLSKKAKEKVKREGKCRTNYSPQKLNRSDYSEKHKDERSQNEILNQEYESQLFQESSLSSQQKKLLNELIKEKGEVQNEQKSDNQSDSDCENDENDYSNNDIRLIFEAKFSPKQKKKIRSNRQDKDELKRSISPSNNQKQRQLQIKRNNLQKKRSFSKNQDGTLKNSQTIDVMQKYKNSTSFSAKASQILERNQILISGVINQKKLEKFERIQSEHKQSLTPNYAFNQKNNVHYDWPRNKLQREFSSRHFQFEIPQYMDPTIIQRKKSKQHQRIRQKDFQELQKSVSPEANLKKDKKRSPILTIKKSILPVLGKSVQMNRQAISEKSMLSQILQQHQKKRRGQRNLRIMFL